MFKKKALPINPDTWVVRIDCIQDLFLGEEKEKILEWFKENLPIMNNIVILGDGYNEDGVFLFLGKKYAYSERALWLMEQYKQKLLE